MADTVPRPRNPHQAPIPLSRAQESMWFLSRLAQDSGVYNLPAAVRLRGPLDILALQVSVQAIVARHEILRTVFPSGAGMPRQQVLAAIDLPLEVVDCAALPDEEREARVRAMCRAAFRRPFDLANGPLFKLVLYRLSPDEHVLLTVFHHLVWDGWSIGIFVAELAAHYSAARQGSRAALPALPVQYADFALWEREWLDARMDARVSYWREALRGHGALELPVDRERPPVQTYDGETFPFQLSTEAAHALGRVSRDADTTAYRTLLAGFAAVLGRWSGQHRFVIGTPVANRHHREVASLIGFFANLLPVPVDLAGDPTFAELLERMKASTNGAFANQDIPFDSIVEHLGAGGDPSRNPIFQVVLALHQESFDAISLGDVVVAPFYLESDTTHFDLAIHLWQREGSVQGYFSYNSGLFEKGTIARLGTHLVTLLEAALANPDLRLSALPLMGDLERDWLESRLTVPGVAAGESVVEVLARRVAANGTATVGTAAGSRTLGDIHGEANRLAAVLSDQLGAGARVAIASTDPLARLVACWGAWIAGAVPVLIDPTGTGDPAEGVPAPSAEAIIGDASDGGYVVCPAASPTVRTSGTARGGLDDIALVSLAADPEVEVSHRQLAERLARLQARVRLEPSDTVCGLAPGAPDAFVIETLWPLTVGARLASEPGDATVLHATPGGLSHFLDGEPARPARLHTLLCGGGYLATGLAQVARARLGCELVYLYAPPEAPNEVAVARFEPTRPAGGLVPAGVPLVGAQVLDAAGARVPVGVTGRLRVGDRDTSDRARWRDDGTLDILGPGWGQLWRDGVRQPLERVRRALLADASVLGCHVLQRGDVLCAYVVTSGMAPSARIARSIPLPPRLRPTVLPVSHIPVDADGRVDEASLLRLPVIDEALARRWEKALKAVDGVAHARVLVRDAERGEQPRLHLDELVPGWRKRRTADRTTTRSAASVIEAIDRAGLPTSHCRGPELQVPPGSPETMVEALRRAAERWGDARGLTVYESASDKVFLSYARLLARARRVASGLHAIGLRRGDRVVLHVERLADHFVAFWGCVLAGVAPVAVAQAPSYREKNAVLSKLWNTWKLLSAPRILSSESLCASLREAGQVYGAAFEPVALETVEAASPGDAPLQADPDEVVFLQLTSGSTGVPKCVPETHRAVIAHVLGASQMNGYTEDDVGLNWLSLDHVVPLLTCHLRDTWLGLPQVHVRGQAVLVDPLLWLDLMEEHRVTLSWAPNFGFKLVNDALARAGTRRWDLSSLRRVMNAGEQVTLPVSATWVRNLAPFGVRPEVLQPAYGMAEVATAVTYANDFSAARGARTVRKDSLGGVLIDAPEAGPQAIAFVDVGPPIPGVQLRITTAQGEVLPESVIGQVQVRGRVTMPGYVDNAAANAETLLDGGWLATGDQGFVSNGRLTITGRTKEIIIVRGANFYCYEIEDVVNSIPGVLPTFSAVCAVDDPMTGTEGMAVFFVPERPTTRPDRALLQAVQQAVTREFGITPTYVVPMARDAFPKTTGGKIQRSQLRNRLAAGEFDALLREIDLLTGRNTVPSWFMEWDWRKAPAPGERDAPGGATILVTNGHDSPPVASGNGSATHASMPAAEGLAALSGGDRVVIVESGAGFSRKAPTRFTAAVDDPADIGRVVDAVGESGWRIDTVFTLNPSPAALVALCQAVAAAGEVRLIIATTGAVQVDGAEAPLAERAALRGLVEILPVEWRRIDACLVDVTGEADPAAVLVREARVQGKDRVVAYRDGVRLVPLLRSARFGAGGRNFEEGDLVVVTGGLGGVGGELCRHLLVQYRVRLLVTGRSSLDGTEGDGVQEGLGRRKDVAERRETLRELEALGEVLYRVADATDRAAMAAAVADAEERFGTRVRAAVHLAGTFPLRLLAEETSASLAGTLAPKLEGARCLDELLPHDGLLVLFGSVYGTFGAAACGGYAASNASLEGFAASRTGPTLLMAWSNWDDIGMSRGYTLGESSKALGFEMIGRRQSLDSFDAALHAQGRSVLIGLDSRRPNISRWLEGPPRALEELLAYHTPASDPATLAALRVPDVAGRPTACRLVVVSEMPIDASGAVDVSRLAMVCRSSSADAILPRNSAERTVAAVWREVLEIERIDIDANFFSLGGQSLLLLKVLARLEQSFGRQITVVDLFRYPTVRQLAAFLGEGDARKPNFDDAASRARKQRAVRHARTRPRGSS